MPHGVLVLSAAFDVVVVETVGVGQSETDVGRRGRHVAFVVQPGPGDALQFLKAGIMEVPDVLVVNKADTGPPAERTRSELQAALVSLAHAGILGAAPPIVTTSARDGTGVPALVRVVDEHGAAARASGALGRHRREGALARARRGFVRRYGELGVERAGGEEAVKAAIERALGADEDVTSVVLAMNPFTGARS